MDDGLSLDSLTKAFAEMLGTGSDPYRPTPAETEQSAAGPLPDEVQANAEPDAEPCEITPRSILEAMLFVGHPANEPLVADHVARLMRGVRPSEIDDLVRELNEQYAAEQRPYAILSVGTGYRLALRPEFERVRAKFHGLARQARLSTAAVEVLSLVAYHESLTADDVSRFRGTSSGAILSQLVRRQLLSIERSSAAPRVAHYRITPRFLSLYGLATLRDLPRSQELDKR